MAGRICIVAALMAEARPIIAHFDLRPAPERPVRVFEGDCIELVVSGIGAAAAATAVRFVGADGGRGSRAWLNVGIAGHRDAEPGTVGLAHKVVDAGSGRSWYPPLVFDPPCRGVEVRTVDDVERRFDDDAFYDMEAAGFYAAALRFSTSEAIQALKVVSDNRERAPERLTTGSVADLVESQLAAVETLVVELGDLAVAVEERLTPPAVLQAFLDSWHFTVSQGRQLERLLRRRDALGWRSDIEAFTGAKSARAVLATLREEL